MNVKFAKRAAVVAGAVALGTTLVTTTAQADPPTYRQLVGVGSDTTQDVMNGLGNTIDDSDGSPSSKLIASYDATGSATIQTRPGTAATTPCIGLTRPNGSGAGVNALRADIASGNHCYDFARSSSAPNATGQFTFIPFGIDAVAPAVRTGSLIGANINSAQLVNAYKCNDTSGNPLNQAAGIYPTLNGKTVHPLIPQAGSGTRKFWASKMGIDPNNLPWCVSDTAKDGSVVEEHDGSSLQRTAAVDGAEDVVPFSIAQWIAQTNGVAPNRVHGAVLESVDSTAPRTAGGLLNTAFPYNREVYNVLQSSRIANDSIDPDYYFAFVGATSDVCNNTAVINQYGFGTDPNCGSTALSGRDLV